MLPMTSVSSTTRGSSSPLSIRSSTYRSPPNADDSNDPEDHRSPSPLPTLQEQENELTYLYVEDDFVDKALLHYSYDDEEEDNDHLPFLNTDKKSTLPPRISTSSSQTRRHGGSNNNNNNEEEEEEQQNEDEGNLRRGESMLKLISPTTPTIETTRENTTGDEIVLHVGNNDDTRNTIATQPPDEEGGLRWLAKLRASTWAKLIFIALFIVFVILSVFVFKVHRFIGPAVEWIRGLGWWGPLLIVVLYAAGTVLCVPGIVFTLSSGFLYGFWIGVLADSAGSTLGACIAFLLGRTFLHDLVAHFVERYPNYRIIDKAISHNGSKILLLLRLTPLLPFNILNYATALTSIRFHQYLVPTWLGMLPATAVYVYIGSTAKDITSIISGNVGPSPAQKIAILVLSGVLLVLATVLISLFVRSALKRELERATRELQQEEQEQEQEQEQQVKEPSEAVVPLASSSSEATPSSSSTSSSWTTASSSTHLLNNNNNNMAGSSS